METKHTKGEWTTEDCSNGGLIVCLGDTKDWNSQRIQIANIANAKLIASSPLLLEALIEIRREIQYEQQQGKDWSRELNIINNAIKKATE